MTCRGMLTISSPVGIKSAFSLKKAFLMIKVRPFQITQSTIPFFYIHFFPPGLLLFIYFRFFVLQENSWYQRTDLWIKLGTVSSRQSFMFVLQTDFKFPFFHVPLLSSSCLRACVQQGYTFTPSSGEFAVTYWLSHRLTTADVTHPRLVLPGNSKEAGPGTPCHPTEHVYF